MMTSFMKTPMAQWAKGYHFDPKFSKYFFHFTLGQKISKVIVLSQFTFFKGKNSFFQFPIFPLQVLKNTVNKKNATIPGASFWFSVYLSTYKGKSEN